MQAGPITAQPSVPESCKRSKRVIWDKAENWKREDKGRMKKIVGYKESQNLPTKSKRGATESLKEQT